MRELKQSLLLLLSAISFHGSGFLALANNSQLDMWRCAANGGINALYCYLRVNGFSCEYTDLVSEQAGDSDTKAHTAMTLARLAAKHGLRLRPVSLTMNELSACALPLIVHMDGESPQDGAFLLLFAISDTAVDYVNGPSATIHEMPLADFRRVWSGHALVPMASIHWEAAFLFAAGLGVALSLLHLVRFFR